MTENELDKIRTMLTSPDLGTLELGKTILLDNCTKEEINQFISDLNISQNNFKFKLNKKVGLYRTDLTLRGQTRV